MHYKGPSTVQPILKCERSMNDACKDVSSHFMKIMCFHKGVPNKLGNMTVFQEYLICVQYAGALLVRGSPNIRHSGLSHYPTNGALPLSNKRGSPIIQETGLSHYPTNGALPLSNERGSSIIRKRGSPIIQQTGLFHYPKTGLSHHVAIGAHPLSEIVCEKGSGFRVCMGEETLSINITIIISCAKGLGFGV